MKKEKLKIKGKKTATTIMVLLNGFERMESGSQQKVWFWMQVQTIHLRRQSIWGYMLEVGRCQVGICVEESVEMLKSILEMAKVNGHRKHDMIVKPP